MATFNPQDYDIPAHFQHYPGDTAEDYLGPFFYHRDGDVCHAAFRVQPHHCNLFGITHGGLLMSFADYCLCMAAFTEDIASVVTVNCNSDFVGPSKAGDLMLGRGDITRQGKNLAFTRCTLQVNNQTILTASGVIKLTRRDNIQS
ncbi:PaaI family thioesterase [Aestuariicella hydrocarbonica]|uniref:PaaI family thioesterase n=1 Tax=Pseudomaricurvus hydrocarbonicus TaxID=1470433 RepID=A0A9E5JR37_9GAMM|nr:PaaI family thioesterase [Aestuariicella hydrocarbonica]NHO65148.1 PaaI family thioesterase [Aestuariicella hydrocarbonica]